jgi:CubicO group peptidase (beta-lactamase class C family)
MRTQNRMEKRPEKSSVTEAASMVMLTIIIVVFLNIAVYVYVSEIRPAQRLQQQQAQQQTQQAGSTGPLPPPTQAKLAQFETDIEALRQQYHIPGMSVAVVQGEQIIFVRGFGYADMEHDTPARENTSYRIASLTKPMAAVIIMQLVAEGRIDLDTGIAAYYPGYDRLCAQIKNLYDPPYNCDTHQITVRHHLNHTAQGIPGDAYLYNGDLYALLSRAAEYVTGRSFETLLTERILTPLHMDNTAASQRSAPASLLSTLASPYRTDARGNLSLSTYPGVDTDAAAGVVSTVSDLAKFSIAMDSERLVSADTRAAMWTPATSNRGQRLPYGLGWFVQDVEGMRLIGHYGWWPDAFSSLLIKLPDQDRALILLANSDGASAPFQIGEYGDLLRSPFVTTFLHTLASSDAADVTQ